MADYDGLIERLLVAENQPQLMVAYEAFLEELFRRPLWSLIHPEGRRIHWRDAESAHASLRTMFDAPGLYLFGSCETPLYIGKTKQALWKRLRGRYIRGERSQCQLAATYEQALKEKGITGFPQEIYEEDSKNHPGTPRLCGAIAFAEHGPETIWFALLPVPDTTRIDTLEERLIPAANTWNVKHHLPGLINKQYNQ